MSPYILPETADAPLVYAVRGGIAVAFPPAGLDGRPEGGPRGLIRVGRERDGAYELLNYIAVEPVVQGIRGFSELEPGADGLPGKPFTVRLGTAAEAFGIAGAFPGAGLDDGSALHVSLAAEPFGNGARPVLQLTLSARHPREVRIRTFSEPGGAPMERCILTATMGNQSRCRVLWLAEEPVRSTDLYRGYSGDGFVEREPYPAAALLRPASGDRLAVVSPDEFLPAEVWPFPWDAWRLQGPWAAQYWRKPAGTVDDRLVCRVNGRQMYWGSATCIPGGIAYENVEMVQPFREGDPFVFGYCEESPARVFGYPYDAAPAGTPQRSIGDREQAEIAGVRETGRSLANGDFRRGTEEWIAEEGASAFRVFGRDDGSALTTYGPGKEGDRGRLYQVFRVPGEARELGFRLHGGADPDRLAVRLWRGERLVRRMTARCSNVPFEVRWSLTDLRGDVVTLEIIDRADGPWGFIGAESFGIR